MAKKKNPRVYMDVSVDKAYVGRMIFELFEDVAPATTENFCALCTGEKGIGLKTDLPLHYKGSFFYRFRRDISYVKGGDLGGRNGRCGESIYGVNFPNEMPILKHDERGLLTMNIADRYEIGSHFVITLKPDSGLDRFHVVFGKIIRGFKTLDKITEAPVGEGATVQVSDCGEYARVGEKRKRKEKEEKKRREKKKRHKRNKRGEK